MTKNKINLLGVGISNLSRREVLEYIVKNLQKKGKKYYIVTPNPEMIVLANEDKEYKNVLNMANLALPDGIGVVWAAKLLAKPLKERIAGVDLVDLLSKEVSKQPITVGYLGGRRGVAERTAECLREKYPGLKVVFTGEDLKKGEKLKCDVLFVAFGSPKQEFWMSKNLSKLDIKVAIGVGGAFDFISGRVARAPKWVQDLGLEWLFRLIVQPWRIKRQVKLIKFIYIVLREKFQL